MKERLIEFLAYLGIGQDKFEKSAGLSSGFVNKVGDSIREVNLGKISNKYPELNTNWLKTGVGDMLKPVNIQHTGDISGGNVVGSIGSSAKVSGGEVNLNIGNGSKDKIIEQQGERVERSYDVLVSQLERFHDENNKKDEYITHLVKESFQRNERNMDRIDSNSRRIDELIQIIYRQNDRIQERADKLLEMFGDILKKQNNRL